MVLPLRGFNMAYIAPNSTVELFKNINLTDNYSDSGYFASTSAKDNHFTNLASSYKVGTYTALSYNRAERGFVRLQVPMSTAIYANYMRFKNTSFENKWFYAFVVDVEYINNEVTQIIFELDYLMTWMGSFTLGKCFVERMHSEDDIIGNNLVSEGFTFDDYVYTYKNRIRPFGVNEDNYCVIILYATHGISELTAHGSYHDGVFSGLNDQVFNSTDISGINSFLNQFSATPDSVVAMYMAKTKAISPYDDIPNGTGIELPTTPVGTNVMNITLNGISQNGLDGYVPKNNKLYTYPYNFCCIDNGQGGSLIMKYEFCGDNYLPKILFSYNVMTPITEVIRPSGYKGAPTVTAESLSLTGYPICSWVSDAFKAWVAQNAVGYGIDVAKDVISFANINIKRIESNVKMDLTAAGGLVEDVSNIVKGAYSASLKPDIVKGDVANGNNLFASGYFGFHYGQMSIPRGIAAIIDNYFEGYGYAFNTIMQPTMFARPYWTYLKTKGCHVEGTLPSDHAKRIEEIIDNGCRFWTQIESIGDYSRNNRPIDI